MTNTGFSISQMHLAFVRILKKHRVLMNKSQEPSIKKAKSEAMKLLIAEYNFETGVDLTEEQVRKRLNNFKTEVKKKTDLKKTGNKPIKLKEWEVIFKDLLSADENPSISCIPGSLSVGADNTNQEAETEESSTRAAYETPESSQDSQAIQPKRRKLKFDETDETKSLTNGELQRLVLLEQLKLIRMQQEELERRKNEKEEKYSDPVDISTTKISETGFTYLNL